MRVLSSRLEVGVGTVVAVGHMSVQTLAGEGRIKGVIVHC
jgi:hypothetical protein